MWTITNVSTLSSSDIIYLPIYNDTYVNDENIYFTFNRRYYIDNIYLIGIFAVFNKKTLSTSFIVNNTLTSNYYLANTSVFYNYENNRIYYTEAEAIKKLININLYTNEIFEYSLTYSEYGKWDYNPFTKLFYHYSNTSSNNIRLLYIFNPNTNTISNLTYTNTSVQSYQMNSTVFHPNGKIYGIPGTANFIVEYNPYDNTFNTYQIDSVRQSSSNKWQGQVTQFDGNIYQQPYDSNVILEFNPITKEQKFYGNFSGSSKWNIQILLPDKEHIMFLPHSQTQILLFNYRDKTWTLFGSFSQTLFQSLHSKGDVYIGNVTNSKTITIRQFTKTTQEYTTQQSMFTTNDYQLNLYKSNFGMNYVHKLWNIFDQETNQPIKRILRRVTKDELVLNNNKIQLQFDNDVQNNPYLYEVYILNTETFNKRKLQLVNNTSLLSNNNYYFNQNTKSIELSSTLVDSLNNNELIIVETIGVEIFQNVKTKSGLNNFVLNSDSIDDKTKIQKLFYINPDKETQHLNVIITATDFIEDNLSSKSWLKFSLDGVNWSDKIVLGTCNYDEKKEFYIKAQIDIDNTNISNIPNQFYDVNLTIIRDELSLQ